MFAFERVNRRNAWLFLALMVAVEFSAIAVIVAAERSAQDADESRISVFQRAGPAWRKALVDVPSGAGTPRYGEKGGRSTRQQLVEPIVTPPSQIVSESSLGPDERVIGIVADGKARAYRLEAFESKSGHLVNDLIDGVPVSVAYCDLTRCLRVYSDPESSRPLELKVAGVLHGEMVVRYGGRMYYHKSGQAVGDTSGTSSLPFTLINPSVTTWKEWTAQHPETRIYTGKRSRTSQR
jgi:hypothetical protein